MSIVNDGFVKLGTFFLKTLRGLLQTKQLNLGLRFEMLAGVEFRFVINHRVTRSEPQRCTEALRLAYFLYVRYMYVAPTPAIL